MRERLWSNSNARACHGLDGHGIAPGIPNLAGQRYRYLVTALSEYRQGQRIHAGVKIMAENLNEAGESMRGRVLCESPARRPRPGSARGNLLAL